MIFSLQLGCSSARESSNRADSGPTPDVGQTDGGTTWDAGTTGKRIFITSETFDGNLGGLAGADSACHAAASSATLGGSWRAWLSTSTSNAIDRIVDVGPWSDIEGTLVFANKDALMDTPAAALSYDQDGTFLASDRIWTGTGFDGTLQDRSGVGPCVDWTTASSKATATVGQVGRADGAAWTNQTTTTCDQRAHLICIEQLFRRGS